MSELYNDVRDAHGRQVQLAAERFAESEDARNKNQRTREKNGTEVHDSLARLEARASRLLARNETPADAIVKVAVSPTTNKKLALERIIDASNELQSWTFLPRGARVAKSVARISARDNGRELPLGTGFLVSPRLLMTNNHVLPSVEAAESVVVEFSAELDIDNQPQISSRFELDPAGFFITDDHLDMTLVLLRPAADGKPAGEHFGWNKMIRQQGKIVVGEPVNVIGHPNGRLKEIAIRGNRLLLLLPDFLHYSTDTEPGNSGSPVYNDQWEVVGLHHAGVPKKDEQGRLLRTDGQLWQEGDGDDAIDWVANEGARTSKIMAFLAAQELDAERSALLAELGPTAGAARVPTQPTGPPTLIDLGDGDRPAAERGKPEAVARAVQGLRGQAGADVALVFLHGRSQQGKDPRRLRVAWMAGLNAGMTRAELPPLDPGTAWFPFYGDRLAKVLQPREAAARVVGDGLIDPAESLAPPPGDPARPVYEQLIAQAASRAGMPADLSATESVATEEGIASIGSTVVGRLQRQLSWLSRRTGLDDTVIALVFADVAAYLGRPRIRDAVLETIAAGWPPGRRVVLVSHSLGTVVAMDVLERLGADVEVPLLVTAGSPLGMDAVHGRLLAGGVHHPEQVGSWLNAWCAPDAVAIGCPLRPTWGAQVTDIVTENPPERAHSITEYLGDVRVAATIGRSLAGRTDPAPSLTG